MFTGLRLGSCVSAVELQSTNVIVVVVNIWSLNTTFHPAPVSFLQCCCQWHLTYLCRGFSETLALDCLKSTS